MKHEDTSPIRTTRTMRISTLADEGVSAADRHRHAKPRRAAPEGKTYGHGWARVGDMLGNREGAAGRAAAQLLPRRATGTPLLLLMVLGVMTAVGIARVNSRVRVLEYAEQITELTDEHNRLLDDKRRLETERAYLRTPSRIRREASERLGMQATPPERVQIIRVQPARETTAP